METITYIFFGVIILTIIFIAYHFKWMTRNLWTTSPKMYFEPMIIEKAYKAIDFTSVIEYTTLESITRKQVPFDYFSTERVIRNEQHKQHIIDEAIYKLSQEISQSGLVEIKEQENEYNPDRRRIHLRLKIYKEQ